MSDELKPCKRCGGRAELYGSWQDSWIVECTKCHASTDDYKENFDAIFAWNARADDAQVIKNAENYKLADDSGPQVIANAEKYELADSRERLEADTWSECFDPETRTYTLPGDLLVPNSNQLEPDSREKLEAEVMISVSNLVNYCDANPALFEKAKSWLNRQAAITERECMTAAGLAATEAPALQAKVDSLTAERDHFRKHVDLLKALIADIARKQPYTFDPEAPYTTLDTIGDYLDELQGNVASMRAERDKWASNAETGFKRIKELEAERDKLREELRIEREAVDACEGCGRVDELTAERDELRGKMEAEHQLRLHWKAQAEELRDKLREKQHVCDVQRDSFLKLERENRELQTKTYGLH